MLLVRGESRIKGIKVIIFDNFKLTAPLYLFHTDFLVGFGPNEVCNFGSTSWARSHLNGTVSTSVEMAAWNENHCCLILIANYAFMESVFLFQILLFMN